MTVLRWAFWIVWGNIHSRLWVRWHGRRFHCPACGLRFWAIPAQHGFSNACRGCLHDLSRPAPDKPPRGCQHEWTDQESCMGQPWGRCRRCGATRTGPFTPNGHPVRWHVTPPVKDHLAR